VTRVVTYPDGTVVREPFTHSYRGGLRKILVNPCDMPDTSLNCPVQVPGVIGQTEADATSALAAAGFAPHVSYQESAEATPGTVIAQSPAGGTYLDEGGAVQIVVATAPPDAGEPDE
jgi:hypothetical protein